MDGDSGIFFSQHLIWLPLDFYRLHTAYSLFWHDPSHSTTPPLPITCPTTAANYTASLQGARGLPLSAEAEAPSPTLGQNRPSVPFCLSIFELGGPWSVNSLELAHSTLASPLPLSVLLNRQTTTLIHPSPSRARPSRCRRPPALSDLFCSPRPGLATLCLFPLVSSLPEAFSDADCHFALGASSCHLRQDGGQEETGVHRRRRQRASEQAPGCQRRQQAQGRRRQGQGRVVD